jgi:hypothetical protein
MSHDVIPVPAQPSIAAAGSEARLFTDTPAGVGALQPGDRVRGGVEGIGSFEFESRAGTRRRARRCRSRRPRYPRQ